MRERQLALIDSVTEHLLKQGKKSQLDGCCMYRGPGGLKCAAGHLIKDEHYDPGLEGSVSCSRRVTEALKLSGVNPEDILLVSRLQGIHDSHVVEDWKGSLETLRRWYEQARDL